MASVQFWPRIGARIFQHIVSSSLVTPELQ
jgi:hypothetical protein